MKKRVTTKTRPLSAEKVWNQLTNNTRRHLIESQKITNAAELGEAMAKLRSQGIADVSHLLVNSDRGVRVIISTLRPEISDKEGLLYGLFIKTADPFLWLEIGVRSKAVHSFLSSKNKIVKIVDRKGNVLYENY
jgi:hypothetical protein